VISCKGYRANAVPTQKLGHITLLIHYQGLADFPRPLYPEEPHNNANDRL
jgi:hypothetical protein